MKKLDAILLIGLVCAIIYSNFADINKTLDNLQDNVLRMHILANSDSEEDQNLKLKVRDKLLECSEDIFGDDITLDSIKKNAKEKLDKINDIVIDVIEENGFTYGAETNLVNMEFDAREYGELTMPAGTYDAVRITLGKANGHNWWCVMYPPLCLPAAETVDADEDKAEEFFDNSEMDIMEHPEEYEIRFKCVDIFKSIKSKVKNIFD